MSSLLTAVRLFSNAVLELNGRVGKVSSKLHLQPKLCLKSKVALSTAVLRILAEIQFGASMTRRTKIT